MCWCAAREARNHVVDDEEGFRILEVERGKLLDPSGDEKPATRSCCGGGGGGT